MDRFSPKIEIINHFDNLINRVDIEIEKSLEKCREDEFLSQCKRFGRHTDFIISIDSFKSSENKDYKYDTVDLWSESTKAVDYLNQVRMRTIEELRKEQNDALENYKSNSSSFQNQLKEGIKIEDFKSQLFGEKFYFQVFYEPSTRYYWIFNLFSICVDFYMSPEDIDLLEKTINLRILEKEKFLQESKYILNEKMVLIHLIIKKIIEYRETENFPNQMIFVRKEDISDIQRIYCFNNITGVNLTSSTIDLSKLETLHICQNHELEEIKLENLSSLTDLRLNINSVKRVSVRKLIALLNFELVFKQKETVVNSKILDRFFHGLPNIEYLRLVGDFSYFNFDNLVRLNKLGLSGNIRTEEFNFDLFKNICSQLTSLDISLDSIDDIDKLLNGFQFPNLSDLNIECFKTTKLEKKLFDGFSNLDSLKIFSSKKLKKIDHGAFSVMKQLRRLNLSFKCIESLEKEQFSGLINLETLVLSSNRLKSIEDNTFSNLHNLKRLDLSYNRIKNLNPKSFDGLRNLKKLNLRQNKMKEFDLRILDNMNKIEKINLKENSISNKKEISSRFKDSKIKLYF